MFGVRGALAVVVAGFLVTGGVRRPSPSPLPHNTP